MPYHVARKGLSETDTAPSEARSLPDDPDAIRREMEGYRPYLLLVANREISPFLRPKGGASDLVQETYLEAHRDLSQFSGRSKGALKGWLRRILRNNLANFARRYRASGKRGVGLEVPFDGDGMGGPGWDGLESPTPSPSALAILRERVARFEHAMGSLKERDRLVLVWRSQDYCDWKEIGRRIGGSDDKARKIWKRAVYRLRNAIGEAEDLTRDGPA